MPDSSNNFKWPVVPLAGITNDTLGSYLFALGIFSIASRRWPAVRSCWRNGVFVFVNGPQNLDEVAEATVRFAEAKSWRLLDPGWKDAAKRSQKEGLGVLRSWRSRASEETLLAFDAHLVAEEKRRKTNPLLDSRGGKRIFYKGLNEAISKIQGLLKENREAATSALSELLAGERLQVEGAQFNAGSWFSAANKIYNHSPSVSYNEGKVSPWEMTFACEGFEFFAGSSSRRLSLRSRPMAGFPFVVEAQAPSSENLCGKSLAEFWAPIWSRALSVEELRGLFARGRVALNGKGAITAAAISGAILDGGTDAGLTEFRRFALFETTSAKSFETRLQSVIPAKRFDSPLIGSALSRIVALRDALPADRIGKGKRWIYAGLRGPLDETLVTFAENPSPESARATVDAMIGALRKADRNRGHRRSKSANPPRSPIRFQQLPGAWAVTLLDANGGDASAATRIALALATLISRKRMNNAEEEGSALFLTYWLGVQMKGPFCAMPEEVPFRRVWGAGTLTANLAAVLHRRLIEEEPAGEPPFAAWHRVALGDIEAWLMGAVDDAEVERWAMRFSLFDWKRENVAAVASRLGHASPPDSQSAELALFALLKPLFQRTLLNALLPKSSGREAAKVGPLPGIVAQLARGDLSVAVRLARNAYRAAGIEPAKLPSEEFACAAPQRLLAALLIPAQGGRLTELSLRWLSPHKNNNHNS